MARTSWADLSPRTRWSLGALGALEAVLKVVALVDLRRRPAAQVRGSKRRWALAIAVPNTLGVVPALYLLRGRRRADR